VKPKDTDSGIKPKANPQRKQLIVLGGLTAVLALVIFMQFGGSEPAQAATAAAPAAETVAPVPGAATETAAAAAEGVEVATEQPVEDNPVLSEPFDGSLTRSPFASFWSTATGGASSTAATDVPPPAVRLEATMPANRQPLAVIDGRLHFVGDSIQGWRLAEIRSRAVVLESPALASFTVEMPVLVGRLEIPAVDLRSAQPSEAADG